MASLTTHYGITDPTPFIDVEVGADNRLYLDPHAIRLRRSPQPFADEAVNCVDSFFQQVTDSLIAGTDASFIRGRALLQRFSEPWETRLGMAAEGFQGHGGAEVVGTWIWDVLTHDVEALVRVGVFRQVEDLPLFVTGIDRDITSDVTTRIVFGPLARFTAAMVDRYPEFTSRGHHVRSFVKQVWNPSTLEWEEARVVLPVVDGRELLLVPQGWARHTLLMSAERFYNTSILSFAQLEQAVLGADGRLLKTSKEILKRQSGLGRGRSTNLRVTLRAFENEQDLLAAFRAFVATRFDQSQESRVA